MVNKGETNPWSRGSVVCLIVIGRHAMLLAGLVKCYTTCAIGPVLILFLLIPLRNRTLLSACVSLSTTVFTSRVGATPNASLPRRARWYFFGGMWPAGKYTDQATCVVSDITKD